ncbi:MAG: dinitrogenase iron-molybdenum cofactor biosynthesis protein [Desulfovibrio sp.]|nr:dinitrogenase iron-molybdenum cofactor biosynthesis protein [Desulfovibrio sp.]
MKIAITAEGPTLESRLDPRFGRAAGFFVHDLETGGNTYTSNDQNLSLPQGAGIQSAQTVAGLGVGAVVTGHVGPKAYTALKKGGIRIFFAQAMTVREAVEAYKAGKLESADGPDKGGHW